MARRTVRLTIETQKVTVQGVQETTTFQREYSLDERVEADSKPAGRVRRGLERIRGKLNQLRHLNKVSGNFPQITNRKDEI